MTSFAYVEEWIQINEYARHTFQVLVTWFTFYFTVHVLLAGAIIAGFGRDKKVPFPLIILVCAVMAGAGPGAIQVCELAGGMFLDQHARLAQILLQARSDAVQGSEVASVPLPLTQYVGIIRHMQGAITGLSFSWLGVLGIGAAITSWHKWHTRTSPGWRRFRSWLKNLVVRSEEA